MGKKQNSSIFAALLYVSNYVQRLASCRLSLISALFSVATLHNRLSSTFASIILIKYVVSTRGFVFPCLVAMIQLFCAWLGSYAFILFTKRGASPKPRFNVILIPILPFSYVIAQKNKKKVCKPQTKMSLELCWLLRHRFLIYL